MIGTRVGADDVGPQPLGIPGSGALAQTAAAAEGEGLGVGVGDPHAADASTRPSSSEDRRRRLIDDRVSKSVGARRRGRMTPS